MGGSALQGDQKCGGTSWRVPLQAWGTLTVNWDERGPPENRASQRVGWLALGLVFRVKGSLSVTPVRLLTPQPLCASLVSETTISLRRLQIRNCFLLILC